MRKAEGYKSEGRRHDYLHGHNPPSLGLDYVHERAPEGLDDPRKIQKAGIHRHISLGHAHVVEHDHGYVVHYEIRDTFGKVQSRYPLPWVICLFHCS